MPDIEINGKKLTVEPGVNIIDAAKLAGTYIPHFCYHKKLSIAASCRMCLVEVEKSPKLLPACATQVIDGMKIFTKSEKVRSAQKSVIEFLLINHPLDCPICDQGGECTLQNIAFEFGVQGSRFKEKKRLVSRKEMGPLISAEEMSRCIHCGRCVRFSQEVAGEQEIGMAYRAEDSEIMSFFGQIISSEISGNMIDICPVGALTSMPFRYSARPWELSRRKSIAPHDGLGSNLIVQVFQHQIKRILPLQNDSINECWLSDRDRFSYEALNSDDRLRCPMIKQDGRWHEVDWDVALNYVAKTLLSIAAEHGKESIGALINPISSCEEIYLLQKMLRKFAVNNIDSRLRHSDFRVDQQHKGTLWLGCSIDDLLSSKSILLIGSSLRNEQPLLAARVRKAVKNGCELNIIHCLDDPLLCQLNAKLIASPDKLPQLLAQVLKAMSLQKDNISSVDLTVIEVGEEAQLIAESLLNAEHSALVLGEVAQNHPLFADLLFFSQEISRICNAKFGLLAVAGNSIGADLFGALPHKSAFAKKSEIGKNVKQMLDDPLKAYLLFNAEAEADCYDSQAAQNAMKQAKSVIAFSPFKGAALLDYADALLPIAPFTETAGCFVNMAGQRQVFNGVVRPLEQTRPGWKVVAALARILCLDGFEYDSIQNVRDEWPSDDELRQLLNNQLADGFLPEIKSYLNDTQSLFRIGEIPLYHIDSITRRAESLQLTNQATAINAALNPISMQRYALKDGDSVSLRQNKAEIHLVVKADKAVPIGALRVPGAHPLTQGLAGLFDPIEIERD